MTIEACQAGKDVYVEKPACRVIDEGFAMIDAAARYKRVVQVGLQQRSWDHFQQCARMVQEGKFGTIYHAGLHWRGSYVPHEEPQEPPPMWIRSCFRPRPEHGYTRGQHQFWRAFYDYAGGSVTDQECTWRCCALVPGCAAPLSVTASAQYVNVENRAGSCRILS
jgi:predicted dehydrogenase